MPDSLAPPAPPGTRPVDTPDPEFWGPPRPTRRERRELTRPRLPGGAFDRVADRLREWRSDPRAGVAALVVVALVAGFAWYRIGVGSAGGADAGAAGAAPAAPVATTTTAATGD